MLIRRQDLGVVLLYLLGYSKFRNWLLRLQHKPVTACVYFHDLPPETIGCFKANLNFLKTNTNVVSLDDFFSGRLSSVKLNVVITFDDGYKSWITDAVPILKQMKLPATFFITSGFVGLSKEDEYEFMRSKLLMNVLPGCTTAGLSIEDVRKLVEEGFTVGGHTLNHYNLSELKNSVQIRNEIAEDKARLEKITAQQIDYFAYPFGGYHSPDVDLAQILKELGYRGAVTTTSGFNCAGTSRYFLHRESAYTSMPRWVFRARVCGNYHAVRFLKEHVNMILQSAMRI